MHETVISSVLSTFPKSFSIKWACPQAVSNFFINFSSQTILHQKHATLNLRSFVVWWFSWATTTDFTSAIFFRNEMLVLVRSKSLLISRHFQHLKLRACAHNLLDTSKNCWELHRIELEQATDSNRKNTTKVLVFNVNLNVTPVTLQKGNPLRGSL